MVFFIPKNTISILWWGTQSDYLIMPIPIDSHTFLVIPTHSAQDHSLIPSHWNGITHRGIAPARHSRPFLIAHSGPTPFSPARPYASKERGRSQRPGASAEARAPRKKGARPRGFPLKAPPQTQLSKTRTKVRG